MNRSDGDMNAEDRDNTENIRLGALYREAAQEEPPPALDAALRTAAARAVRPKRSGLWAWRPALATAAVMVLIAGMLHESPRVSSSVPASLAPHDAAVIKPSSPPASPAAVSANPPSQPKAQPRMATETQNISGRLTRDPPAALADTAEVLRQRPPPLLKSRMAQAAEAAAPVEGPVTAAALAPPTDVLMKRGVAATPSATAPAGNAPQFVPGRLQEADDAWRDKAAEAPVTLAGLQAQEYEDSPEKWAAHIEDLRRRGDLEAARKSLAALRQRYPAYVLPAALKALAAPILSAPSAP